MRKFFSQKSKHKAHQHQTLSTTTTSTLTGSSSVVVSPSLFNKDDETQTTSIATKQGKSQATSSHSQTETTNSTDILINSTSNESISSELKTDNKLKQDENGEKSKKLFVVVSGKKFLIKNIF
jgi:hypothetical protein